MTQPGDVYCAEAYALGKMLDHSAWQQGDRRLPRGITASDIDAGFNGRVGPFDGVTALDNLQRTIFIELSRHCGKWVEIQRGQRWVYKTLVTGGPHCAVICRHNVDPETGRKICTRHDVVSFQPMFYDHGIVVGELFESNQ